MTTQISVSAVAVYASLLSEIPEYSPCIFYFHKNKQFTIKASNEDNYFFKTFTHKEIELTVYQPLTIFINEIKKELDV